MLLWQFVDYVLDISADFRNVQMISKMFLLLNFDGNNEQSRDVLNTTDTGTGTHH